MLPNIYLPLPLAAEYNTAVVFVRRDLTNIREENGFFPRGGGETIPSGYEVVFVD